MLHTRNDALNINSHLDELLEENAPYATVLRSTTAGTSVQHMSIGSGAASAALGRLFAVVRSISS
jgi:hypothetical protein